MLLASYSSADRDKISQLLSDLRELGHDVWLDQQLSGGQVWWDEILGRIRECEAFLILVTPSSMDSEACLSELGYAQALDRAIIPVEVVPTSPALLPSVLSKHQIVRYTTGDKSEMVGLTKALRQADIDRPLPDPAPPQPPLPGAYSSTLRDQVGGKEPLTLDQQVGVLHRLQARADDDSSYEEIGLLLRRFRRRDDLYASVAEQLDALEKSLAPPVPPGEHAPGNDRRLLRHPARPLDWVALAIAGAALLAGLIALSDPVYEVDESAHTWASDDRWLLVGFLLAFGLLALLSFTNLRRLRRIASIVLLVVSVLGLASWWSEITNLLAEAEIATNSGPITLGPGMNLSGLSLALQVIAGVLLVVGAFSTSKESAATTRAIGDSRRHEFRSVP